MNEDIKKILDEAVWAPSGDNTQPWRFELASNDVRVFNVPEQDTSLYNYHQHASLVALGGLIENISIASPSYGYTPSINLSTEEATPNMVAVISLKKTAKIENPLYPYIKQRTSNRRPYDTQALSAEHKRDLLETAGSLGGVSMTLVDRKEERERVADASSVNEKVVLENVHLHNFLFHHITWNTREDERRKGLFVQTLELHGPQMAAFRLFRNWRLLSAFNRIGASNFVSRENARLYKQSGAFIAITADDTSALSFLKSGILMQRLWLAATKIGLGVQPLTGVLFLHHRFAEGDKKNFSQDHVIRIKKSYDTMVGIFDTGNRPITMMFRVGYAEIPRARCLRREPTITTQRSI